MTRSAAMLTLNVKCDESSLTFSSANTPGSVLHVLFLRARSRQSGKCKGNGQLLPTPTHSSSPTYNTTNPSSSSLDRRFRQRHRSSRKPIQRRPDHPIRHFCHLCSFRWLSDPPLRSSEGHADIYALLGYPCDAECCSERLCRRLCCEVLLRDV